MAPRRRRTDVVLPHYRSPGCRGGGAGGYGEQEYQEDEGEGERRRRGHGRRLGTADQSPTGLYPCTTNYLRSFLVEHSSASVSTVNEGAIFSIFFSFRLLDCQRTHQSFLFLL